jgi:hypothetical protein
MADIFSTIKSTAASALSPMTGGGKKRTANKTKSASACEWHSTGRKVKLSNGDEKTVWVNDKRERRVRKMVHRNGRVIASYVKF